MNLPKMLSGIVALSAISLSSFYASAADTKPPAKPKPYILKTCAVSGEKLDSMGEPFVFTYQGRELKLCCKECKTDFDKTPAKYIKKVEEAEKKEKRKPA